MSTLARYMLVAAFAATELSLTAALAAPPRDLTDPCLKNDKIVLNASERAGCEIWLKATAGNARFYTYVFQQRLGVLIDWYGVLNAPSRGERFRTWGLINDPACCTPGDPDCPMNSLDNTYGFDYCPGDDALLAALGERPIRYRDPACDFQDAPRPPGHPHAAADRQSACDLEFGTSAGAMGFRKFPNPRFNPEAWLALNGTKASWEGFRKRLADASMEPPFRIGISCGACHVGFNPLRPFTPPYRPEYPAVQHLSGTVGNQYARIMQIFVSGMPRDSFQWQVFGHARPGTVDTSAIPTDQINNAGTMNAFIDFWQRPLFTESITKWRPVSQCVAGSPEETCWCEPGKATKCWRKQTQIEQVPHFLKGGEDGIGVYEALQRVYLNIGSCAEVAWINHLTDLWQFSSHERGYGQTPVDIGQTRRDCANWRAIEDRRHDLLNYVLSGRSFDLREARENDRRAAKADAIYSEADLIRDLDEEFGAGAVERGRRLFAAKCATCHSSRDEKQFDPFRERNFRALLPGDTAGVHLDHLGSDEAIPAAELAINPGRALHSNHLRGHVWEEFASAAYHERAEAVLDGLPEGHVNGGRGYYRAVSLLSVWAHAPFLHHNAVGPEVCGTPHDPFYTSPYMDAHGRPLAESPPCWPFDPSVEGRYRLFKASIEQLFTPPAQKKIDRASGVRHIGPFGIELRFPPGVPAAALGNFRHKDFIADLQLVMRARSGSRGALTDDEHEAARRMLMGGYPKSDPIRDVAARTIVERISRFLADPGSETLIDTLRALWPFYTNNPDMNETRHHPRGHPFFVGAPLNEQEKRDRTAFLATL